MLLPSDCEGDLSDAQQSPHPPPLESFVSSSLHGWGRPIFLLFSRGIVTSCSSLWPWIGVKTLNLKISSASHDWVKLRSSSSVLTCICSNGSKWDGLKNHNKRKRSNKETLLFRRRFFFSSFFPFFPSYINPKFFRMKSIPRYHTYIPTGLWRSIALSTECYFHFLSFCFPTKCAVRARENVRIPAGVLNKSADDSSRNMQVKIIKKHIWNHLFLLFFSYILIFPIFLGPSFYCNNFTRLRNFLFFSFLLGNLEQRWVANQDREMFSIRWSINRCCNSCAYTAIKTQPYRQTNVSCSSPSAHPLLTLRPSFISSSFTASPPRMLVLKAKRLHLLILWDV